MKTSLEERTREALRDEAPERRINKMWTGVERRRSPKTARSALFASTGLALAAAAALAFYAWPQESGPLALEDGSGLPTHIAPNSHHVFSDGSRIEAAGTVDTLSNVAGEVAFALRSGDAHFDIVPHGPRRWRVVAGQVEVVVVGTVFDVARSDSAVDVRVERGVVLVRGDNVPDGEQRLEAGDSLRVLLEGPEPPNVEPDVEPEPPVEVLEEDTPAPTSEATSLEELLRRADAARREGRHEQAVRWLSRVSSQYAEEPRAALAAFTQGRIELDSLDRPAPAARSFARSLQIGLPRPLRETAQALHAESLSRAGDPRAPASVERFLTRYPQSVYRQQVLEAGEGDSNAP